jgi:hypothetical protein
MGIIYSIQGDGPYANLELGFGWFPSSSIFKSSDSSFPPAFRQAFYAEI